MLDTDDTRGLSQRELLLEVRQDIKDIRDDRIRETAEIGKRPTRPEIYSAIGTMSVLMVMLSRFLGGG